MRYIQSQQSKGLTAFSINAFFYLFFVLYCIVSKYLYSAPQQPWANRGTFDSISSKKRDKF